MVNSSPGVTLELSNTRGEESNKSPVNTNLSLTYTSAKSAHHTKDTRKDKPVKGKLCKFSGTENFCPNHNTCFPPFQKI